MKWCHGSEDSCDDDNNTESCIIIGGHRSAIMGKHQLPKRPASGGEKERIKERADLMQELQSEKLAGPLCRLDIKASGHLHALVQIEVLAMEILQAQGTLWH